MNMAETAALADEEDLFSDVLHLEDKYHAEGFSLGSADGARAGRIEGRTFGLEKGFEKFSELGRLGGRAAVWSARLNASLVGDDVKANEGVEEVGVGLKGSERLRRQVERLRELTDPESLSTVNDEESVNAFDNRLREARAKGTLVGKMVGEKELDAAEGQSSAKVVLAKGKAGAGGKEMEDFAGLPMGQGKKEERA